MYLLLSFLLYNKVEKLSSLTVQPQLLISDKTLVGNQEMFVKLIYV